jgi:hypothetical protein
MILLKISTAIYLHVFLIQSLGLILGNMKHFFNFDNGLCAFKLGSIEWQFAIYLLM